MSVKLQTEHLLEFLSLKGFINIINQPRHEISNNVVCAISKALYQSVPTCSLIRAFASRLNTL